MSTPKRVVLLARSGPLSGSCSATSAHARAPACMSGHTLSFDESSRTAAGYRAPGGPDRSRGVLLAWCGSRVRTETTSCKQRSRPGVESRGRKNGPAALVEPFSLEELVLAAKDRGHRVVAEDVHDRLGQQARHGE